VLRLFLLRRSPAATTWATTVALVLSLPLPGTTGASGQALTRAASYSSPEIGRWSRIVLAGEAAFVAPLTTGGVQAFDRRDGTLRWTAHRDLVSSSWNVDLEVRGDTLVVFDPQEKTRIRLTFEGDVIERRSIPSGTSYRTSPDGGVLFTGRGVSSGSIGRGLHELTPDGGVSSYGIGDGDVNPFSTSPWEHEWKLVEGAPDEVWTHFRDRFRIVAWDLSRGEPTRELRAPADWLTVDEGSQGSRSRREGEPTTPMPSLHGVYKHGDVFWVLGHTAQPDWRDAVGGSWDGSLPDLETEASLFDSVIEAWSATSEEPIEGIVVDDYFYGVIGPGLFFEPVLNPDDTHSLVVWQATDFDPITR